MKRREMIRTLGASFVGAHLSRLPAPGSRLDRIGLELYAVRDQMRRDPERTLAAVRAMGYVDVELLWSHANFGRTTQQVRAALDREGLRAPSAHMAPEAILGDWEKNLETAKVLGHEYLIVPSLPAPTRTSLEEWRKWADHFNRAGAFARRAGIWLGFHNEPDHQKPIAGEVPYDLFLTLTDPRSVRHQLDVGNMVMGGGDPLAYLARHRSRYWSFHIKDVVADRARDTELGTGSLDFRKILAAIPEIQRKPVYVEQEGANDSLASARRNLEYLRNLEF